MTENCYCGAPCATCAHDTPGPASNRPGQSALHWRIAPHGAALGRMRALLAEAGETVRTRSLASQSTADPSIALLDSWAVVTDVVSFYTERIAQEGFLRTATETGSVRQHARSLGYELRPGVAAEVELVFEVESAPGVPVIGPDTVVVPAGTPVQTVPPPGALPQTFETSAPLEARAVWNAIPGVARVPQPLGVKTAAVWMPVGEPVIRLGDSILFIAPKRADIARDERATADDERWKMWDLRRVVDVEVSPPSAQGWARVHLDEPLTYHGTAPGEEGVRAFRMNRRLNVFGWNAPDPSMLRDSKGNPLISADFDDSIFAPKLKHIDLDGDHPAVLRESWLVLEGHTVGADDERVPIAQSALVKSVASGSAGRYGISGKVTRVGVDAFTPLAENPPGRRSTLVHAVSEELPVAWMPRTEIPAGADADEPAVIDVVPTDPPVPVGRLVVLAGVGVDGEPVAQPATVTATRTAAGVTSLTLDRALVRAVTAESLRVHANAVLATHGETVEQVLGSGDGRAAFPRFALRRAPLTHVPSTVDATGATAALEVRVEDVAWTHVPSLLDAKPADQVYIVRQAEDGVSTVVFGDGIHGSRLPTGSENVRARYRVGIGADGAADTRTVVLPVRKPRGIASATNLTPSRDWAPPETLEQARTNAPQRIRTLDRAVSVADYEDFARGYAGVSRARADLVWDGRVDTVVVSLLDTTGESASADLVRKVRDTLEGAREDRPPFLVLAGEVVDVGAELTIDVDPRWEKDAVKDAVTSALLARFGGLDLGAALAASAVLVVAAGVEGVSSASMPALSAAGVIGIDDALVVAEPARLAPAGTGGAAAILPAQSLRLRSTLLTVGLTP